MGTRTGDVDYGALAYIAKKTGLDVDGLEKMANRESGLLGLSELSNDCRTLTEAAQAGNHQAEETLDVFVFRLCRYIGALDGRLCRASMPSPSPVASARTPPTSGPRR